MAVQPELDRKLEDFYAELKRLSIVGHWQREQAVSNEPRADVRPWLWRWQDMRACALAAAEVMPVGDEGAERRALTMQNPTSKTRGTTRTLVSAIQIVYPGEEALSHRHTNAALRFIIEGEGAYTIVDGQPVSMAPGDFLITPSWSWHGHAHDGSGPMMWLDVLDAPLIAAMDWRFYEEYDSPNRLQPAEGPCDSSLRRFAAGGLVPLAARNSSAPHSPLFRWQRDQTLEALDKLTEDDASPYDGLALAYTDPSTGGPVMPTIDCTIQRLPAGYRTKAHRHTTNTIYHVVQGSGFSVIDGLRFDWQTSDTFCVPNWCWHEHSAAPNEQAVLFAASDAPVLQALHVYREQAYENNGGHQLVTGTVEGSPSPSPQPSPRGRGSYL